MLDSTNQKDQNEAEKVADPPKNEEKNINSQQDLVHYSAFQGPIPPPSAFKEYEEILPGSAHRILSMAEKSQQIDLVGRILTN